MQPHLHITEGRLCARKRFVISSYSGSALIMPLCNNVQAMSPAPPVHISSPSIAPSQDMATKFGSLSLYSDSSSVKPGSLQRDYYDPTALLETDYKFTVVDYGCMDGESDEDIEVYLAVEHFATPSDPLWMLVWSSAGGRAWFLRRAGIPYRTIHLEYDSESQYISSDQGRRYTILGIMGREDPVAGTAGTMLAEMTLLSLGTFSRKQRKWFMDAAHDVPCRQVANIPSADGIETGPLVTNQAWIEELLTEAAEQGLVDMTKVAIVCGRALGHPCLV